MHRCRLLADRLLITATRLCRQQKTVVMAVGRELLALPSELSPVGGQSILNYDGTLLQVCLTARTDRIAARVIADPAAHESDAGARAGLAREALDAALEATGSEAMRGSVGSACEHLLLDDGTRYRNGPLWIAAGLGSPGLACYIDAKPAGETAWAMARDWLKAATPAPPETLAVLDAIARFSTPASFGVEGTCEENARAKIYFRLDEQKELSRWGVPLFEDESFARFLSLAMADFDVSATGLVGSVGFRMQTGEPVDAKIDLCGCRDCLNYSRDGWQELINELEGVYGLAHLPVAAALADEEIEVAFLGFGLEAKGRRPRLNLYLKSRLDGMGLTRESVEASMKDGIDYLRSRQNEDGSWTEYELPVGSTDQWITGFVGMMLAEAGAEEPAAHAADWLASQKSYEAGWGYNANTGPDADSTAFALRLIQKLGRPVADGDREFLKAAWRPSGGFATYPERDDAWGEAHVDVTPLAYLCLSAQDQVAWREDLLGYLKRTRLENGHWPAYWWRESHYATYLVLMLMNEIGLDKSWHSGIEIDENRSDIGAFNQAAMLGIQSLCGKDIEASLCRLVRLQRPDGSWPGSANLRVTEPDCFQPWKDARGKTYEDKHGILTTALVVGVLSSVMNRMEANS